MWTEILSAFIGEVVGKLLMWFIAVVLFAVAVGGGIVYTIMK